MAIPAPTIDADLEAVTAALAGVQPRPGRVLLFGSRARGDARPDSDLDLLVVMPQATLTPQERQQALRLLREALRPLSLSVGVDLVVVGEEDAERLAGSRWHVVARALREGKVLNVAAEDALLLEPIEAFHAEVRQRLS
jgi:predicted nucleotidyltransferase